MKDKALYLRMDREVEYKERVEKAFVAQVRRDHHVWSLGDEDKDNDNNRIRDKCVWLQRKRRTSNS